MNERHHKESSLDVSLFAEGILWYYIFSPCPDTYKLDYFWNLYKSCKFNHLCQLKYLSYLLRALHRSKTRDLHQDCIFLVNSVNEHTIDDCEYKTLLFRIFWNQSSNSFIRHNLIGILLKKLSYALLIAYYLCNLKHISFPFEWKNFNYVCFLYYTIRLVIHKLYISCCLVLDRIFSFLSLALGIYNLIFVMVFSIIYY